MEITNALLVALMFITILTIGVGNILTAIASIVDHRQSLQPDWILVNWIVLLLLLHLDLFWETLAILEKEKWAFGGFLYVLAGPMLLFIAGQFAVSNPQEDIPSFSREHYLRIVRKLFSFLTALMIWSVGMDAILGNGFSFENAWNIGGIVVFGLLAVTRNERVHAAATIVAWILLVALFALRATGVFT